MIFMNLENSNFMYSDNVYLHNSEKIDSAQQSIITWNCYTIHNIKFLGRLHNYLVFQKMFKNLHLNENELVKI